MNTPAKTASQQLAEALQTEIRGTRIARVLSDAMSATMTTRAGTVEPDHRTRLAAAETALAHLYGLPVRREESIVMNIDAAPSVTDEERLQRSPCLRKILREMLEKAEAIDV